MPSTPRKSATQPRASTAPVTQGMIARRLGVSQPLVALALADSPRVAPATRDRVIVAAREMGYSIQHNDAARRLIAQRFGTRIKRGVVSVLLGEFENQPLDSLPYFAPMLNGMEAEAATRGIDLAMHFWRQEFPRLMRDGLVDGVIDFGTTAERTEWLREHRMPAVSLGGSFLRHTGDEPEWTPGLGPDNSQGTLLATEHLLALGHRRIAYIGDKPSFPTAADRYDGYRQAHARYEVPIDRALVVDTLENPGVQDGRMGAELLLARKTHFTAAVCYNDTIAMGFVEQVQAAGLRVPQDVSITGFDDISPEYKFVPGLTSVRFDRFELGQRAIALLCEIVDETTPKESERFAASLKERYTAMPVELVVRESSCKVGKGVATRLAKKS